MYLIACTSRGKLDGSDKEGELTLWRKRCIFATGLFETSMFGYVLLGWAQLVHLLKAEGVFSNACNTNDSNNTAMQEELAADFDLDEKFRGCEEQDKEYAFIYTVGSVCYTLPAFFSSYLRHHVGLVPMRILTALLNASGFIVLGMVTADEPQWLLLAIILMSMGSCQTRLGVLQFANLFPEHKCIATSTLGGSSVASGGIFLILQLAVSLGVSRTVGCWFLAGLSLVTLPVTVIMPFHQIPYPSTEKETLPLKAPLRESIATISGTLGIVWFFVISLSMRIFVLLFNPWTNHVASTEAEVSLLSSILSATYVVGPFISFLPGLAMHLIVKRLTKDKVNDEFKRAEIRSCFFPLMSVTLGVVTLCICHYFQEIYVVYIFIAIYTFVRPSIHAIYTTYLRIRFAVDHFDRIYSLGITINSSGTLLLYQYFLWYQENSFQAKMFLNIILIAMMALPLHTLIDKCLGQIGRKKDSQGKL